ncbi:MAG TPA: hypothetical protein HA345_04180 [Candidatus Thalassarchaeaceae archaeon]|nr:MAG TPA: hypothetical protein D7H94_04170 [Candidatus Poseidoniales archaeon]HIH84588.1 hypothetical protein [Candidatus Thalassarchaeaceae archaeon]
MARIATFLLTVLIALTPLTGCTSESEEVIALPEYNLLDHTNSTVEKEDYLGAPYVILFSAQWCGTPCHNNMHNLNTSVPGIEVVVVSTEYDYAPQGVSMLEWIDIVNEFDDDGDDIGQTLEYTFTRVIEGDDFAEQMDVFAPGTVIFVNSVGEEIQRHEGSFGPAGDEDTLALIQEYWNQIVE